MKTDRATGRFFYLAADLGAVACVKRPEHGFKWDCAGYADFCFIIPVHCSLYLFTVLKRIGIPYLIFFPFSVPRPQRQADWGAFHYNRGYFSSPLTFPINKNKLFTVLCICFLFCSLFLLPDIVGPKRKTIGFSDALFKFEHDCIFPFYHELNDYTRFVTISCKENGVYTILNWRSAP
ncbi:MAG: hypothetical protein ACR2IL_08615 [Chitinophagaceae bacterium]